MLVFSKTEGFRHQSIEVGINALQKLGEENNYIVEATEDATRFTEPVLKQYDAVIFLSTTGDVLDYRQQAEFERYIQAGGGFVGIHAAADTEYEWPWYGKLVGAYFESHPGNPNVREATLQVTDHEHLSTNELPDEWQRTDEWYNYKDIYSEIKVLINLDESSYEGGTNGENHPIAWYHPYDGGRAFYTGGGHTSESFSEPLFLQHLLGGIQYAIGEEQKLNYNRTTSLKVPEENRFTKTVLDQNLNEPTELAVMEEGKVLFIERKGKVKLYTPEKGTEVIAQLDVHTEFEDGLMGLALDPDYKNNHWIYMYYSPAGRKPVQHLSRFTFKDDSLLLDTEKVMLEVPVQRKKCCHTGGSIAFDASGNLYLSTGDNTSPFESDGFAPIDERKGRSPFDAQKSSGNTNDLRGKILRIHPNPDGTYDIPEGNLFAEGQEKTRPEIYVMGNRNPYRISLDSRTGYLYWGEVGPDAGKDSVGRGPRGHDEINQARQAGNFGWPYFVGNNKPYWNYDFSAQTSGELYDPAAPINNSPNNTGLQKLPAAQKAFIWYPYAASEEFPLVGSGGRNAMAGPVFYQSNYEESEVVFPGYYNGKLFIYDWIRGWIMAVTMDEQGNLKNIEPFLPGEEFNHLIDMAFASDGSMYLLEYGTNWFAQNEEARLSRITYNAGNRNPVVKIAADKKVGAVPLTVNFSSEGTIDYDYDSLQYEWTFTYGNKVQSTERSPEFSFNSPGIYKPTLKVTDTEGNSAIAELEIKVGNEPPEIAIVTQGNSSFFYDNSKVNYEVVVEDKEDGTMAEGGIKAQDIQVNFDYLPQGYDLTQIAQGHQANESGNQFIAGKALIDESDCKACHAMDVKSVGPSYKQISDRYKGDAKATDFLSDKIIKGGGGVWGEHIMAAHPQLSEEEARKMVGYILAISDEQDYNGLPAKGEVVTNQHKTGQDEGAYIFRAAYTDKGGEAVGPLQSVETIVMKHPKVQAENFDKSSGVNETGSDAGEQFIHEIANNSYILFKNIDLTGIEKLGFHVRDVQDGSTIEVHLNSPEGKIIAATNFEAVDADGKWMQVDTPLNQMVNEKQDVYFVFINDQDIQENLLELDWIYYHKSKKLLSKIN